MLMNSAYYLLEYQIKILHSLQFDPEATLPNHGFQINSCSVLLVDIKKEKPFFNLEVEWQTQARTDCNQAPDVIGKADTVWSRNHRNRARGWGRSEAGGHGQAGRGGNQCPVQ